MTEAVWLFLGTAMSVVTAMGVTLWRGRKTSPETQSTLVGAVDLLLTQLQKRVDVLERQVERLQTEHEKEEARADAAEHRARRLDTMPADDHPMSDFVEDGWLDLLNEVAEPEMIQIGFYLDDIDGRVSLGYRVEPLENATIEKQWTPALRAARQRRRRAAANAARVALGYEPVDEIEARNDSGPRRSI